MVAVETPAKITIADHREGDARIGDIKSKQLQKLGLLSYAGNYVISST